MSMHMYIIASINPTNFCYVPIFVCCDRGQNKNMLFLQYEKTLVSFNLDLK